MPSKITLQFNSIPLAGEYISLDSTKPSQNFYREIFAAVRTEGGQATIGAFRDSCAYEYINAFNADYNTGGIFTVNYLAFAMVTIEHPDSGFFTLGNVDNGTAGSVTVDSIVNSVDPIQITIDSIVFSQGSTPCDNVSTAITTSVLATKYRINSGPDIANALNPFTFEPLRGQTLNLEVENAEGNTSSQNIQIPDILVSANVSVGYVNAPSGATVTISVANQFGLDLEYSLDNVLWQSSNVYTGILQGNYTVYVRDQLGCQVSEIFFIPDFEEGGVGERFPYSDLPSKSNSLRFEKYIVHGTCGDYKNDENTLSSQLPYTENASCYEQLFQNCDTITTQLKNNYENNVATVVEEDGTETVIPVVKKSDNTNQKDRRDARRYNLAGLGVQTGIYFTSGNLYDYDTGLVTGSYALNGGLPAWGVVGNYVFVDGGWFQISNIVYDDSKSAYVLVIDSIYTGLDEVVDTKSVFNYESYEIHEFVIDMNNFANKKIQVNVAQTDSNSNFPDVVYLSEIIDLSEVQEGTVLIEYYNDSNTDIFYSTGIKNRIRIPIEFFSGGYTDLTETERTDINSYLIDSEGYENDLIAFKLMPKQMMRKLFQALAHKFVFINEVQYVKEESPEINHLIGTNLYRVSARMTKANAVYTSQGVGEVFNVGTFEVPALLEGESEGYIKIK